MRTSGLTCIASRLSPADRRRTGSPHHYTHASLAEAKLLITAPLRMVRPERYVSTCRSSERGSKRGAFRQARHCRHDSDPHWLARPNVLHERRI